MQGKSPQEPRSRVAFMREVNRLAVIGIGGALGALSRAGVSNLLGSPSVELTDGNAVFPWATMGVNILGALLIGILAIALAGEALGYRRPFLITGFLGGFTTFSALALEVGDLVDQELWFTAFMYLSVTVGAGLLAVRAGMLLARKAVKP